MKIKKLKLHLAQYKNTVEMRVLEQCNIHDFESEHVRLASYPELADDQIYLRGGHSKYNYGILCKIFGTEEQSSEYLSKVIRWLDDVFYDNVNKEIEKGDEVFFGKNFTEEGWFIADLGKGMAERYLVATSIENGLYTDLEPWNSIRTANQSGYDKETNEYYGEITNKEE